MALDKRQHLLLLFLIDLLAQNMASESQPKPGCQRNCGSLNIPYPFGTTEGCYLDDSFLITCQQNSTTTTPYLGRHPHITVLDISLDGELRISTSVAYDCYNKTGNLLSAAGHWFDLSHFFISRRNKLTVIGCDTVGIIAGWDYQNKNYTTGCLSLCNNFDDLISNNGSCSGSGCCQTSIPDGLSRLLWLSLSLKNYTFVHGFDHCGYAFLAEDGAYNFSYTDVANFQKTNFSAVIDWAVENQTCQEAQKNHTSYACKAENSECLASNQGVGYLCKCSPGFRGNPYLVNGCEDIDECVELDPCHENAACINFPGSFGCSCKKGYEGDGTRNGLGCRHESNNSGIYIFLVVILSVTASLLALLVGSFYIYWGLKERKLIKLKEKFFQQNGGILLQQQIARHRGAAETTKIFSANELRKATDNFHENRVLGQGGHGTVYKGILPNNTVVAIKKSKISDQSQIEQFINEVIVLSQVNHRNVVKLLGCCLETKVPLLVYEFITNGTLSKHLHDQSQSFKLSWTMRLRVATETAGALAYLHSATCIPIIHRDVKTSNILLDDNLTAKVSDFGASRFIPLDQTQLTTLVQGTLGYLDPEYFQSSQLTEKSDVYSFGVVLAELLTSKKALCFGRAESDRNLSMYFISSMVEGRLLQIVDQNLIEEANVKQIVEVANLARRCLGVKGEDRPTMKEVAMELEGLRAMERHPSGGTNGASEKTDYLFNASSPSYIDHLGNGVHGGCGSSAGTGSDSINEISVSLDCGR